MIPGPIEFEPEVLAALGRPTLSHTDPDFAKAFETVDALLTPTTPSSAFALGAGSAARPEAGAMRWARSPTARDTRNDMLGLPFPVMR